MHIYPKWTSQPFFPRNRDGRSISVILLSLASFTWSVPAFTGDITIQPVFLNLIEQTQVPALEEGPVTEIFVQEGREVEVAEPLVQIDDRRPSFLKQQAEHELKVATKKAADRSSIQFAETEFKVANASLQRAYESRRRFPDTPSQAEVDEIELKVAQAKQHLDKAANDHQLAELAKEFAEQNLKFASYGLERHRIQAPIRGTVVEIFAKRGDWLRPGDPVARIIRIDRLRVEGNVERDKLVQVAPGCAVTVVINGPEQEKLRLSGKITFINPEVDPNDGRQRVLAEIDNSQGRIGPGMRALMVVHAP